MGIVRYELDLVSLVVFRSNEYGTALKTRLREHVTLIVPFQICDIRELISFNHDKLW